MAFPGHWLKNADFEILRANAVAQSANIARLGHVKHAQAYAKGWGRKMKGGAGGDASKIASNVEFVSQMKEIYTGLGQQDKMVQDQKKMSKMRMGGGGGGGMLQIPMQARARPM